jgi:hypothetical protein
VWLQFSVPQPVTNKHMLILTGMAARLCWSCTATLWSYPWPQGGDEWQDKVDSWGSDNLKLLTSSSCLGLPDRSSLRTMLGSSSLLFIIRDLTVWKSIGMLPQSCSGCYRGCVSLCWHCCHVPVNRPSSSCRLCTHFTGIYCSSHPSTAAPLSKCIINNVSCYPEALHCP